MNLRALIGYIAVIIIGIGFIMMAAGNVLGSITASTLQGVLGAVFIVAGCCKALAEMKRAE